MKIPNEAIRTLVQSKIRHPETLISLLAREQLPHNCVYQYRENVKSKIAQENAEHE